MTRYFLGTLAVAAALACATASADTDPRNGIKVEPVVIDTGDGTGTTLGAEFSAKGTIKERNLDSTDFDFENARIGGVILKYEASGTVAADEERNPKNFLNASLDGSYRLSRKVGAMAIGGFWKYEADQSFDNKQSVYGARATFVRVGLFADFDWIALDANYGRIDPKEDKERQTALGTTALDKYYRTDLEFEYLYPVSSKIVQTFEFNYRYFIEHSAPAAIKTAKLDRHHLITYRVGLPNDFFVAYSSGTLPFDRKSDKIYEIGLSYKLQ